MVKHFFVGALGVAVLITLAGAQNRIRTVTTGAPQGAAWVRWDRSARIGFVRGYLSGIHVGYRDGCFLSNDKNASPTALRSTLDSPFAQCLDKALRFSKEPDYYETEVSRFYLTYKSDIGLPLDELLRFLSDSENKTPEEIHEWFASSRK
jgi:hypothetical protein